MKRVMFAFALGLSALTLTACDDDGYGYYGGVYSASYPHYRYYDDYYYYPYHYGPVYRGYWDNRQYYHRGDRHWRDDDARSHPQGTDKGRSWDRSRGGRGDDKHRNWRRDRD